MENDSLFETIKENLNGRPGQPIVLGVCQTLAKRCGQEVWVFRAGAIVLGVFFTFATLACYILLGLFMSETEERTRGLFRGLGIWFQELFDRLAEIGRDLFSHPREGNG